jgi:hypothetical protein
MVSTDPVSLARKPYKKLPKLHHRSVPSLPGPQPVYPPVFTPIYSTPSPAFMWHLIDALKRVPVRLRKALSDWGYTILAAPSIVTPQHPSLPNPVMILHQFIPGTLMNKIQDNLRQSSWWQTLTSLSKFSPKTILMPEIGLHCQGMVAVGSMLLPVFLGSRRDGVVKVDHFGLFPVPAQRPGLIMLHELGHAVDDFLGGSGCRFFLSQSKAFNHAYQKDIAGITDHNIRRELSYYLPRTKDPMDRTGEAKAEAFAQVFAHLKAPNYGNPHLAEEDARFLSFFPRVAAFIRKNVFKPWRWESKASSHGPATSHTWEHSHKKEAPSDSA